MVRSQRMSEAITTRFRTELVNLIDHRPELAARARGGVRRWGQVSILFV